MTIEYGVKRCSAGLHAQLGRFLAPAAGPQAELALALEGDGLLVDPADERDVGEQGRVVREVADVVARVVHPLPVGVSSCTIPASGPSRSAWWGSSPWWGFVLVMPRTRCLLLRPPAPGSLAVQRTTDRSSTSGRAGQTVRAKHAQVTDA
jgi:hypothetical protein